MMTFKRRFATNHLVACVAVIAAACGSDAATGPTSDGGLRLEAVSATQLTGTVGEPVDVVPTVIVKDRAGHPLPGIALTFTPGYSSDFGDVRGDTVATSTAITNSRGIASAGRWVLGTIAGAHELQVSFQPARVSSDGTVRVVDFYAAARPAAAAALRIHSGDGQIAMPGETLDPPLVEVTDRFGNRAGGITVTFAVTSGGGSVATTRVDESSGLASPGAWTLGPGPGTNSIVASAPGLNSVTFSAHAIDAGTLTWYDLPSQASPYMLSASIALGTSGVFDLVTFEMPMFGGEKPRSAYGTYTLTGTSLVLTYASGATEQGTLAGDSLSLVHTLATFTAPPQQLGFVRRP